MDATFLQHSQIKSVATFNNLISTVFSGNTNAVCWHRKLEGDFEEIVSKLRLRENITEVSAEELLTLELSAEGDIARKIILSDLKLLTDIGASPSLNLLKNYERDEELDFFSTDVYSFHVDRSDIGTDTFLCTYHGPASDILPNEEATQKILIPEIREKLKDLHDGSEEEFEDFLASYYFDLHYQPMPGAKPINLGSGHLWRLAIEHPEQRVLPCIHRAPAELKGEYRLLLIC